MDVNSLVKPSHSEHDTFCSKPPAEAAKGLALEVILLGLTCCMYFVITSRYFKVGFVDDTYISLRYVRHLVQGHGLVWNVGEKPVEGFTNLGWILLLACFGASDVTTLQGVARQSGMWCGVLVLVLTWLSARKLLPSTLSPCYALIVPLHLAFNPVFCRHSISGMETMLTTLILAVLIALWTYTDYRRHAMLTSIIYAGVTFISGLVRPDAILFGIAGTLGIMLSRRAKGLTYVRESVVYGSAFILLLAVFLIWKQYYFGSIVPLPFYMKQDAIRIFSSFHMLFFVLGHWFGFITYSAPLVLIVMLAVTTRKYPVTASIVALSSGILVYGFYFLTVLPVMSFDWRYLFPLYPGITLLAFGGIAYLIHGIRFTKPPVRNSVNNLFFVITLFLFAFYNFGHFSGVKSNAASGYNASKPCGEIGKSLANIPNISIAHSEAGQLPYFSDKRFLDIAGLNDTFVAKNRFKAYFSTRYGDYVKNSFGLPDVYLEPLQEYSYARLERFNSKDAYDRYIVEGIPLYVLKSSSEHHAILDALNRNKTLQQTEGKNDELER